MASASLNAKDLADRLGLSKARVSQYVAQGKLVGCFTGEGRARRFDVAKVAEALGHRLDLGQMMGNGAETRRAIKIAAAEPTAPAAIEIPHTLAPAPQLSRTFSEPRELDRYEEAKIQSAEQDARRKTRDNARDEGRWVLAEEVQRSTASLMAAEVAKFESVIREGARAVADHFGIDYREVRQILMQQWRSHRGDAAAQLGAQADAAEMSEAEKEADV